MSATLSNEYGMVLYGSLTVYPNNHVLQLLLWPIMFVLAYFTHFYPFLSGEKYSWLHYGSEGGQSQDS